MTDETLHWCVLIPCSSTETWAVPQICLAEIVTLHTDAEQPPAHVTWRDREVPVMDMGTQEDAPWSDSHRGSGLIAIFLGREGEGCEYWGVAVRGDNLTVAKVGASDIKDMPDAKAQHATAAFELNGQLFQVPDLDHLQQKMALA